MASALLWVAQSATGFCTCPQHLRRIAEQEPNLTWFSRVISTNDLLSLDCEQKGWRERHARVIV